MDPEKLLEKAEDAIRRGVDPVAVNARLNETTGGQFPTIGDLRKALQGGGGTPEDPLVAAQKRLSARGGSALTDFLRMGAQGATFGLADELAGIGAGIAPGGRTREEATAESRQRVADLRLLAPGASTMAEIAGGAALPAAGGAKLARGVARGTGSRAAGAIAGGSVAGGGGGFAYGAGEAEGGLLERLSAGVKPGAIGAGAGGLLGAGASAVGRLGEKAVNAVGDTEAGGRIRELLQFFRSPGASTTSPAPASTQALPAGNASGVSAQAALRRALREAGILPDEALAPRLSEIGPDAVVADLGPNLGREARAAANQSSALAGPQGPIRGLERRAAGRGERIAQDLRESSGITRTFDESLEAAEQNVKAVRDKFYKPLEEAFEVVSGRNISEALTDPRIREVARRVAPDLVPDATEGIARVRPPAFRELQDIMMELRDDMTAARAAGRPNRSEKAAEAFDKLIGAMQEDIPGFREAQTAYRVAQRRVGAHELGQSMWSSTTGKKAPREILAALNELPDEEAREAFRLGMLDKIEMQLRERVGGGGPALSLINADKTMLDRLRVVAQNDEGMARLIRGLDRESMYSRTWSALAGNSTTTQQVGDVAMQFVQDIPTNKQALLRRLLASLGGLSPAERRQAAEMLGKALMGQGKEAAELLAQDMVRGSAGAVGAAGGAGGGVAGFTRFGGTP